MEVYNHGAALSVVVVILLVLGFCSISAGNGIEVVGGFLASLSPVNLLLAAIQPDDFLRASFFVCLVFLFVDSRWHQLLSLSSS